MSRVQRRAGTKALVCSYCVKQVPHRQGITPRNIGSFRGTSQDRLDRHIQEVHIHPRMIHRVVTDD